MTTRITNVITRMIVGGPQQVCLSAGRFYREMAGFEYDLISGIETGAEGHYLDEIDEEGIPFDPVPDMVRNVAPVRDTKAMLKLLRRFRSNKPDVVHTRSAKARFVGTMAARMAGVPVIVQTVHGWSFNNQVDRRKRAFVELERMIHRLAHCTVFVSQKDLQEGIDLGVISPTALEDGEVAIIRSGIDLATMKRSDEETRQAFRADLGSDAKHTVIALVQRLSHPKTPLVFLDAIRPIMDAHPELRVWIVGDGDLRAESEQATADHGMADRVQFLGLRKDIPAILSAADISVHSSIREGLPRVVLESLAVGTPLIATDVGGVRDVIDEGKNALLVPHSNVKALTDAIQYTLDDPKATAARAKAGIESLYPFSAEKMLIDQHELYTRLLAEKGAA